MQDDSLNTQQTTQTNENKSDTEIVSDVMDKLKGENDNQEIKETQVEESNQQDKEKVEDKNEVEEKTEQKEEKEEEKEELFKLPKNYKELTPEELLKIKKDWERAYTRKRQKETAEVKELKERLAQFEKEIAKKNTEEEIGPQKSENGNIELGEQEALQLANQIAMESFGKPLNQLTFDELAAVYQKYGLTVAKMTSEQKEVESYITHQEEEFYKLDDRLNEDTPAFDPYLFDLVSYRLSIELEKHNKQGKPITEFDFVGKARTIINQYDEFLQEKAKEFWSKNSQKNKQLFEQNIKTKPMGATPNTRKSDLSLEQAVAMALENRN